METHVADGCAISTFHTQAFWARKQPSRERIDEHLFPQARLEERHKLVANGPPNALTVDVEDYFHSEAMNTAVPREQWHLISRRVEQNTNRLFELFASRDVRGTFFFLGWVAERFPALIRQAVLLGHEIACHSYWHRLVYRLSPEEFREDTRRAKAVIEDAAGVPVRGYRAPSFSMIPGTEWALQILAELDFQYDSSVCPVRHDLYCNPHAPRVPYRVAAGALMEFPVATISVGGHNFAVGGGGYLRILPYWYTHWGLSRLNQADGLRAVVYTHPWEIDPEQPRLQAPSRSRFRQYTGLRTTKSKLERLLGDFRFAPIKEIFSKELMSVSNIVPSVGSKMTSLPVS
jgi:polysaccharide deacetylase family protein (PEP-CTERM system associated)